MKINQVEELAGITKKNIRFYEDEGLLCPERNPENGYREYSLSDVAALKRIRLFRLLSIPISDIREINAGTLSVKECAERALRRQEEEKRSLECRKRILGEVSGKEGNLSDAEVEEWLQQIARMEKEGASFVDIRTKDVKKKKYGALIAAAVMIGVMAVMIAVMFWGEAEDPIPLWIFLFFIAIFAAIIVGIVIALWQRFRELNKGEEDEASKY